MTLFPVCLVTPCLSHGVWKNPKSTRLYSFLQKSNKMMFQPLSDINEFNLPTTVGEVVDILYIDLSLREKVIMASLSECELDSTVYLAMAKIIRKEFGLYNGNTELISSCLFYLGKEYDSFEDPAMVIIKELWKKVKQKHHLRIVKR